VTGALLVVLAGMYLLGVRRFDAGHPDGPFPRRWVIAFAAGLLAVAVAVVGPVDRLAGELFSWHMVQHLFLLMVAPPLLMMGRPVLLARRAAGAATQRAVIRALRSRLARAATHPAVGWACLAVVLWATHFTGLYQRALTSAPVHALEHGLYLGAGLLFWFPVVGAEPSPRRLSHPARLLYLFVAASAGALLASTLYQSERVLYRAYDGAGALADQRAAGAIMWIGGGLLFLGAVLLLAASWARHERREGDRADARLSLPAEQSGRLPAGDARLEQGERHQGRSQGQHYHRTGDAQAHRSRNYPQEDQHR
jgi:putative membrane protein